MSVLNEALPYIQRFHGKTFVIKYGGAWRRLTCARASLEDVVLLKAVGMNLWWCMAAVRKSTAASSAWAQVELRARDAGDRRADDGSGRDGAAAAGNKDIVALLSRHGCRAVGLSGKDGDLIVARKLEMTLNDEAPGVPSKVDIVLVGEVAEVNPQVLRTGNRRLHPR